MKIIEILTINSTTLKIYPKFKWKVLNWSGIHSNGMYKHCYKINDRNCMVIHTFCYIIE